MSHDDFNMILERRIQLMRAVLSVKAKEYATGKDRLHNCQAAADELGGAPAENAWGFVKKQLISVRDLILGDQPVTKAMIDERIGDAQNYLVLIEALLIERLQCSPPI